MADQHVDSHATIEAERAFWLAVREALLMLLRAVERYKLGMAYSVPTKRERE